MAHGGTHGASALGRAWGVVLDNSLLLIAGTVTALIWANLDEPGYEQTAHALHFAVNDIAMVFFFGLAAKEVFEATLPGGALASPRHAAVPLLAAAGGMLVPALLYTGLVLSSGETALMRGWAIPCATDIAFSYLAARFIFPPQHPAIPFLLLLAIADDAMGLIILAVFYPTGAIAPVQFVLLFVPALAVAWGLRKMKVVSFWPYVLAAGGLCWTALYLGGFHPALALVPIVPFMPHEARDLGIYAEREDLLPDTLNRFEHWWKVPVQFVLFFFGFANAGVPFSAVGFGTWAVLTGLLVGKPIGIWGMTRLAETAGLGRAPGLSYRDVLLLGCAAGIGFTVSLFFATAAFPPGEILAEAKMGALLSFVAAPLALLLSRLWPSDHPRPASARAGR